MHSLLRKLALPGVLVVIGACGGGPVAPPSPGTLPTPSVACASVATTQLTVGQHLIVDPSTTSGCLRVPASGPGGAQYLVVLGSTSGVKSSSGVQGPYLLRASNPGGVVAAPTLAPPASSGNVSAPRPSAAAQFDATLRGREQELLAQPGARIFSSAPPITTPPVVGEVKDFHVCANLACTTFGTVTATLKFVGTHAAVYLDNTVPTNDPLRDSDLAELGTAFDTYHYPIDTTAFGRESDIDGNGVVDILMTDAVNSLTPDCADGRVLGFFFGSDLLNTPNSNHGEIFYTLVPAPQAGNCNAISRRTAVDNVKPTLIHEFQHMISFNQHSIVRAGNSEEVWLNEALSHFAEELGGRLIPDAECTPAFPSCRSQYTSGDIFNAYDYLTNTEADFVVFPTSSTGTLPERGAAWLFLRWTLDQFAAPDPSFRGTDMTRALVGTTLTGAANLAAVTGSTMATMTPEWMMAIYLDDGPDLPAEPTGRLSYKSWGLRTIWTDPRNVQFFPAGFPLNPDVIGGSYSHAGTLKAGSGRHFLISQPAQGAAVDLQVLKSTAGAALDPALLARFGIVRIH
ncbi:MAG TPA: hypothetical protein VGP87_03855 [Gemmatimonadales bacterium]|nr:hypothetical protein [Gemmatimonadales bacterium]